VPHSSPPGRHGWKCRGGEAGEREEEKEGGREEAQWGARDSPPPPT